MDQIWRGITRAKKNVSKSLSASLEEIENSSLDFLTENAAKAKTVQAVMIPPNQLKDAISQELGRIAERTRSTDPIKGR